MYLINHVRADIHSELAMLAGLIECMCFHLYLNQTYFCLVIMDIYNIRTLSENMKFIAETHCEH